MLPKFRRIRNVRILIGMRDDLLDLVLAQATTPGFQREKFEDQRVKVSWTSEQLLRLVNKRINRLFKSQYTNADVDINDIAPAAIGLQPFFMYVCDRTMMRPRDVLAYFNIAFSTFGGNGAISQKDFRSIELDFSTTRRRALVDE